MVSRILGLRAVLTGAGCRWWVQGCAVVAEVTAAGLGSGGCRVAVGRAAGAELVPRGRLVEAQLTGCGGQGGFRGVSRAALASPGTALTLTQDFQRDLPRDMGADPEHHPVPPSLADGGTEAQRGPVTYTGLHS